MKKTLITFSFTLSICTCLAQWNQIGANINGEAPNDESGASVSMSYDGNVVAVGARWNDDNGKSSGHVRVYKNDNGSWTQIGTDIVGEAAGDYSGRSVSLNSDGNIVAIGAHGNDGNGIDAGHVRVYKNDNGSWTQIGADIDGEIAGDQSGSSVSLSSDGNVIAIGAPRNNGNPYASRKGQVRVYRNDNGTWIQIGANIYGEKSGDQSGSSVSLSSDGNTVAIGAPFNFGPSIHNPFGHVRVYKNNDGTWTQVGSDIDGETAGDRSGGSVSLSADGSIVAIGAEYNYDSGVDAGHVRVYENNNGAWIQIGSDIDGEAVQDYSGHSVSLSSDGIVLAIGAWGNDEKNTFAGQVRIYKNDNGRWIQVGSDIEGEAGADYSGSSVSLSADGITVAIGAWGNDGNGTNAGNVKVYSDRETANSVSSSNFHTINIYPNPTLGIINVNAQDIKSLIVTDINGVLVKQYSKITTNTAVVDLSGEASGVYLLSAKTETQTTVQKIILE